MDIKMKKRWIMTAVCLAAAAGMEAGASADEFAGFINGTLVPSFGYVNPVQNGTVYSSQDKWLELSGILSIAAADFDLDGTDELLVAGVSQGDSSNFYVEMYENENGQTVLSSHLDWYQMQDTCSYTNLNLSLADINGKKCILWEQHTETSAFANGEDQNYGAWVYENGGLKELFSFTQTEGGSIDFAFTGREYENGNLVSEELLYSDREPTSHSTVKDAMNALYGKYGIALEDTQFNEYGWPDYTPGSVIARNDAVTGMMDFNINCVNANYAGNTFEFASGLTDYTGNMNAYFGMPEGSAGVSGGAVAEDDGTAGAAAQDSPLTTEQAVQLLLDYYNNQYPDDGTYVAFDSEMIDEGDTCIVTVRYQMSDEEAARIMENGGFPSANTLVAMVRVDKNTAEASADGGLTWSLR